MPTDPYSRRQRPLPLPGPLLVFVLVALAQLPLVLNPGYFSHDELQWAAFAAEGRTFAWGAIDTFQYRPLTFNLWLWLSAALFGVPIAFHAVLVAAGAANAALASALARRLGAPAWSAVAGAVVFGLGPYAMFVHGWVGTLADVLWLAAALLAGLAATARLPLAGVAVLVAACTTAGLLAKEAAVSIPPLLALAAWLAPAPDPLARRRLVIATMAAGAVVGAYLALRLQVLLGAPQASSYAVSVTNAPLRWWEHQLFPFNPRLFEIHGTLASGYGWRAALCTAAWAAVVAALARAGWRWPVAFLLGGFAALAPALPLPGGGNQYGYAYAAVASLLVASAWPRMPRWGRLVVVVGALVVLWHGVTVMRVVRMVGERQAVFSPAVAAVLARMPAEGVLRLRSSRPDDQWIYQRLVHDIPHYAGVPFGGRVRMAGEGEPADAIVLEDGRLAPAPRP